LEGILPARLACVQLNARPYHGNRVNKYVTNC
jgi:hypothetical protein